MLVLGRSADGAPTLCPVLIEPDISFGFPVPLMVPSKEETADAHRISTALTGTAVEWRSVTTEQLNRAAKDLASLCYKEWRVPAYGSVEPSDDGPIIRIYLKTGSRVVRDMLLGDLESAVPVVVRSITDADCRFLEGIHNRALHISATTGCRSLFMRVSGRGLESGARELLKSERLQKLLASAEKENRRTRKKLKRWRSKRFSQWVQSLLIALVSALVTLIVTQFSDLYEWVACLLR